MPGGFYAVVVGAAIFGEFFIAAGENQVDAEAGIKQIPADDETVALLEDAETCRRVDLDLAAVGQARGALPFQADADDFLLRP